MNSELKCGARALIPFLAVLYFALMPLVGYAADPAQLIQQLSPEQLSKLQQLSPEQRAELLRMSGNSAGGDTKPSEFKQPDTSSPRDVGVGRLEMSIKTDSADEKQATAEIKDAAKVDVPVVEIQSQKAAEKLEIRRAYEEYIRESKPLIVDTAGLQQFGYELFATQPSTFAPVTDVPVPPEYVLGPGDEIKVQMYGSDNRELALTVDRQGAVSFPQIGPITVSGMSFAQAKALLAEQIKQKMIGVSASITMGQLRSIRIFALGDVHRPGSYTVSGLSTLSNALFASGGIKKVGSLRNIELKRNGRTVTTIDLYDFLLKGDTSRDVRLLPGDVVFVPPVGKSVSIAGQVVRPAIYELKNEKSVAEVLNLAGGLMPKAYSEKAMIERIDEKGEQKVINFSLKNKGTGILVKDGDVIKVFAGTEFENNQILLVGNLKRPGKYAWEKDMRISSLIASFDDLLPETFMDYGVIERESPDTREPMMLRFKLGDLLAKQPKDEQFDLPLMARDKIYVFKRADFRQQPQVSIQGSVKNPGDYEHKLNMKLADLVLAAGGMLRNTDMGMAEVYRTDPQTRAVELIKVNLASAMSSAPQNDILLQDMDRVVVHSVNETKLADVVSINGEVNRPATMPLAQGMRVADLVLAGGNLTEAAHLKKAEITRYKIENGDKRITERLEFDLSAALQGDAAANLLLQPYDVLTIRQISNWRAVEKVEIRGEIKHPGTYPVEEGERLSTVLERAGGYTADAFLKGAVFVRASLKAEQQKQLDDLVRRMDGEVAQLEAQTATIRDETLRMHRVQALDVSTRMLQQLRTLKASGRLVVELADIAQLKKSGFDLQLRDGDKLYIPKKPDEVMVVGEVYTQSALLFHESKSYKDYLKEATPTRMADMDEIYVVRADGKVETDFGGWFSSNIGPGDTIVVPQLMDHLNVLDVVLDWSRATMQIGTSIAAMKAVGVFK